MLVEGAERPVGGVHAGLAAVLLSQGDLTEARGHIEEILRHLKTGTLEGYNRPFWIYLTCYQVLRAAGDPRARSILTAGHNLLQEQASKFTDEDEREFQASYSRISQWAKRHDKSDQVNYVAPEIDILEKEFDHINQWFKRIKKYKN
ncbi:MAG: hypothetical protein IH949_06820 [Bacteroidetes bacterium]|nr:hypothetical protein [Bacteroidota bacterium]